MLGFGIGHRHLVLQDADVNGTAGVETTDLHSHRFAGDEKATPRGCSCQKQRVIYAKSSRDKDLFLRLHIAELVQGSRSNVKDCPRASDDYGS